VYLGFIASLAQMIFEMGALDIFETICRNGADASDSGG
jgi:hypothetical protein